MDFPFIKEQLRSKLPEMIMLLLMVMLLCVNLSVFLEVDVWRQDSMYYVDGYGDKLANEGRWINYLFFRLLRLVPSDLAILFSYACVIVFTYIVAWRVNNDVYFSVAFSTLCALIPVIPVQLEWPETLLIGFGLLAFSPLLQRSLPQYIFFPLIGILFFGTFSAFYFLMPLLFLKDLNYSRFWRLMIYWIGSFVLAYIVTNGIIYLMTGNPVQLAGWRHPHYVVDFDSLIENIIRVRDILVVHMGKVGHFLKPGIVAALMLTAFVVSVIKKQYFVFIMALICSLAIYVSSIPVGIYVQERTTLCSFIALLTAFFVYQYRSRRAVLTVICIMFLVSIRMGMASHDSIRWYKAQTDVLTQQFQVAIRHQPGEVRKLFIMVEMQDSFKLFKKIEENIGLKNLFSEGFVEPQSWVSTLKKIGYTYYRVCPNLVGWECEVAMPYYQKRAEYQQDHGLFISHRLPEGDLLLMINPHALK